MSNNKKHPFAKVLTMAEISAKIGLASHPAKMVTIHKSAACGPTEFSSPTPLDLYHSDFWVLKPKIDDRDTSEMSLSGLAGSIAGDQLRKLWESGVYSNTPAPYDPYAEILKKPL